MTHLFRILVLLALALFALRALPADDQDLARQALQQGQVLPLRSVIDKVESEYQGQVVKIEFEHEDGRYVYEIRLLQKDGRIAKLKLDAVDGRVLEVRRKEGR